MQSQSQMQPNNPGMSKPMHAAGKRLELKETGKACRFAKSRSKGIASKSSVSHETAVPPLRHLDQPEAVLDAIADSLLGLRARC
jgi:hypothetical protein